MKQLFVLCILLLGFQVNASGYNSDVSIKSTQLVIAASGFVPPYVIQQSDSGYQLELIKASLRTQGIENIEFVYMSNKRAEQALKSGMVDVAVNLPNTFGGKVFASDTLLSYQNVAISLKENGYRIETAQDLKGFGVVAFQNASAFLGNEYRLATKQLRSYEEIVNQFAQVELLMKGWADVIVMERRIFEYYLAKYAKKHPTKDVVFHPLFNPAPRPIYFLSESMRDVFNLGLNEIKITGEYQAILATNGRIYAKR
ncbi:transporter substrate-binding domain-containing protein (plasmid) [Pseudoalteromonas xiamenensis]|uniref:substrate-binding periplasmic protein n=1 Tax=Pseudoalteromonas xiamenensis TaxID=882626 RepID=UPI0027E5B227|nr:transporter substrate-binding domain-containing protein [Pseudoalteromonas xiamenensis]WMN62189.1 transporter substrate-binding domain-containing protein [Pseudoalteromonas xiamenensis]